MAKTIFEEMGGKYERQRGLFDTVLNCTRRRRTADRHLGTAAFGLSEASLQSYIHQSSYKRQT